jgi:hypothetical protein
MHICKLCISQSRHSCCCRCYRYEYYHPSLDNYSSLTTSTVFQPQPNDHNTKKWHHQNTSVSLLDSLACALSLVSAKDSKGIIHKEFLPEGQTVNSDYYLGVLNRLWARILWIRPEYREQRSWCSTTMPHPTNRRSCAIFWPEKGSQSLIILCIRQICLQQISGCSQRLSWRWKETVTTPSRTSKGNVPQF